ncbi:MAG: type IV pilus assembly protein PilM [bacterium]|nr:type IV pilus assembly protein PilM [bacterium]
MMAGRKRSRAKRLVLDVGYSAVRLCELTPTKTGYQLTRYHQREFAVTPEMEESEQQEVRSATLAALLKETKIRTRKAIVGVPGQSVFMRPRALPPVPDYKVNQIIRYEILQQIPFSIDQIAYDYQVLNRTEAGGYEVLMAAIKVDVVEKCVSILKDVKRSVGCVDVCPLAAYNWLKHSGEFGEQGECVALVDLGASTTDIVIERDGQFRFPRSINFGGNDITSAISREFGMSWEDAEKLKRERGFAPTGDAQKDGKGGQVIGGVLTRLMSEITRSFAYFRSQPGGGPVSRVVVTGGGACLRYMIPFMQRQLGVEVRIAQPLTGLAIAPGAQEVNEHPEQAPVVLGLALRSREHVPIEIDLIPPRVLEAARRQEQALYYAASIVVTALILASMIPVRKERNEQALQRIEQMKQVLRDYDPKFPLETENPNTWKSAYETQVDKASAAVGFYADNLLKMEKVFQARPQWLKYMNAINDARVGALKQFEGQRKLIVIHTMESTQIKPVPPPEGTPQGKQAFTSSGFPPDTVISPAQRSGEAVPVPLPNGMTIRGYATDWDLIEAFIAQLEEREEFRDTGEKPVSGVYYQTREINKVPMSVLYSAPAAMATPRLTSSSGERSSRRSGGLSSLGGGARRPSSATMGVSQPTGPTLRTFRIDLQYGGNRIENAYRVSEAGQVDGGRGGRTLGGEGREGLRGAFGNRGQDADGEATDDAEGADDE